MPRFKDSVLDALGVIQANQKLILDRLALLATEQTMADVKTNVSKVEADLVTIKAGIADLNTKIQDLNNKLNAGTTLSAADAQALDQLAADADALAATFPVATPGNPAPPAPPAGV